MNYTDSYRLPQWGENDRILRTDFNNAMAAIESGMIGNRNAAQEAAKLPYATGSYEGNGDEITITTGFQPRFVVVTNQAYTGTAGAIPGLVAAGTGNLREVFSYNGSGFTVTEPKPHGNYEAGFPRLNTAGKTYYYIAFR